VYIWLTFPARWGPTTWPCQRRDRLLPLHPLKWYATTAITSLGQHVLLDKILSFLRFGGAVEILVVAL
jgi:hypothetical protein